MNKAALVLLPLEDGAPSAEIRDEDLEGNEGGDANLPGSELTDCVPFVKLPSARSLSLHLLMQSA